MKTKLVVCFIDAQKGDGASLKDKNNDLINAVALIMSLCYWKLTVEEHAEEATEDESSD